VWADHASLLCEFLELVERGELRRLMVFMPPRHSKSYHVSDHFPAWYLGHHPEHQVIQASYATDLAEGATRHCRDQVLDPYFPFREQCQVRPDVAGATRWETTQGGIMRAVGVRAGTTGREPTCSTLTIPSRTARRRTAI
jgi:hypothetical protein